MPRCSWAAHAPTDERCCQTLGEQALPDISAVNVQDAAALTLIAPVSFVPVYSPLIVEASPYV